MRHAVKDTTIISLSIVLAIIVAEINLVERLLLASEDVRIVGSFIAGLFFTSLFTTAPAIVILGEISQVEPVFIVAIVGAVGAVIGDLLIFYLFRDHISNDLDGLIGKIGNNPIRIILKNRGFRWAGILIGALIIASPFPDELGIAMMGVSKLNLRLFIPISFIFNFLGILAIGFASRLIF